MAVLVHTFGLAYRVHMFSAFDIKRKTKHKKETKNKEKEMETTTNLKTNGFFLSFPFLSFFLRLHLSHIFRFDAIYKSEAMTFKNIQFFPLFHFFCFRCIFR